MALFLRKFSQSVFNYYMLPAVDQGAGVMPLRDPGSATIYKHF